MLKVIFLALLIASIKGLVGAIGYIVKAKAIVTKIKVIV